MRRCRSTRHPARALLWQGVRHDGRRRLRSVELTRIGPARFKATNVRGGETFFGTGGEDPDFTPVELLLAAIAGCGALDVEAITHKRTTSTTFEVHAEGTKVRDEHGNHLTGLRVVVRHRVPRGPGRRRRPRPGAGRDRDVPRPAVHGLADRPARRGRRLRRAEAQPTVTFSMVTSSLGAPPPAGLAPSLPSAAIASMVSRPASSIVPKTV